MKLTKKLAAEITQFMEAYWEAYFSGDLKTWATYLSDDYRNIGTTKEELWNSKQEIVDYTYSVIDQVKGMAEVRDRKLDIIPYQGYFMVNELANIYVKGEKGWTFYESVRLSTLIEKTEDSWLILHQHGSYPDSKADEGETFAFDKLKAENKKLRVAVEKRTVELEQQNRDLEIEAALERVRSRTMAMQHSDELIETSELMFEQIKNLDIELWSCGFSLWYDDNSYFKGYNTGPDGKMGDPLKIPLTEDVFFTTIREAKLRGDDFLVFESKGESLAQTYSYMDTLPVVGEFMRSIVMGGAELPKYQVTHCGFFSDGHLMFISREPNQEAIGIFKRFTKVFDQTYTRFLDLQKAEAQAREVKIDTALEKVRSRTMAMQKGEELQEVVVLLYKELIALEVTNFVTCGFVEVNEDQKRQHTWVTSPGGDTMGLFHLPLTGDATFDERYAAWKNQETVFHQSVAGQVRSDHLEYAITTFNSKEAEAMVRSQFPDPTVFYCFNFPHGYLHTVGGSRLEKEEEQLLARFTKVFAQTYTRFLDLQKAEAQAREAQIETALEKVRSRTMGMQSSDELPEVANMLFLEIQELGIPAWSCGYCILEESRKSSTCIMSSEGTLQTPFILPHRGEVSFEEWDTFVHSDETFFTQELGGADIESHYNFMKSLPQLKPIFQDLVDAGLNLPTYQINHLCKFTYGFLLFITYEEVPGSHDIFKRFTSVFDQTYTRFLDLQKAEAQAREAQIELSMERVRAKVTAMKESADLLDIVVTMRTEFVNLSHEAHYFWHMRWLPEKYEKAMTSGDGTRIGMVMTLPRHIHGDIKPVADWEKGSQPTFVLAMDADTAVDYVDKMITLGDFQQVDPQAPTLDDIRHIGGLTFVMARTTHGEIGFSLPGSVPDPPNDAIDTLVRFAGVFDLAYKRFEDLKYAERQHREAQIELALERVRSRSMAMHKSEELAEVALLLFQQIEWLEIETFSSGFKIWDDAHNNVIAWMSNSNGMNPPFEMPIQTFAQHRLIFDSWKKKEVFMEDDIKGEALINHYEYLRSFPLLDESFNRLEKAGMKIPDRQVHNIAFFSAGYLLFITLEPCNQYHPIFKRFAKVFEQTYTRFLDLQKAEAQALRAEQDLIEIKVARIKAEEALSELQATQSQLIQSEKMASLGELTAGIAHEIQNPLNFVNNFSEVSTELIDEMNEELEKGNMVDVKEISVDLKQNLEKINHHGKRAGDIVKGMLQHSRSGSSQKELIDLNALCDEYLRLAYHGLRAKDKSFNAKFETSFDEHLPKIEVMTQDIGRVVLNLINNAFYTVSEKAQDHASPQYTPTVSVSTKKERDKIQISVKDNGNGIPDDIKEKIFQPFFTTKPTGKGTGLGLSLSYDIVKAHGGELQVKSTEGEVTEMIIFLPIEK